MKSTTIYIRLVIGVGIAVIIFASSLRASLEDILAPLPIPEIKVAPVASISARPSTVSALPEVLNTAVVEENVPVADAILSSDVRDALSRALEDSLRPNGEITLIPLRDLPDLSKYSRPFHVNMINMPGRLSRGNILLAFQVENEKGVLGEWSVPFRVHLYSDVWFSKAHLRRGNLASPSDFEARPVDLLVTPNAVPANLESLMRHEYGRDLTPGKTLVWTDLVERSLIKRGDVVEVSAVQGLLAITVRAVARQDGSQGDLILLKNIDSAKEFSAKVTGENRAEIVF